ncbi:MAG: serine/threonine protein kinase, partial [Chloroflexi bacterium]|nr:serine/threonine protein kinase [Chloroflexota bacterium]
MGLAESDMGLKIGDVLAGKFKIIAEIGEGGFGKTYLGYDAGMDRQVAIKELLHESAEVSPEDYEDYKRRFRKEAQVVSKFSHPNVVTAYSLESDDEGDLYLVLEYVDGGSLKNLLAQGPLEPARAVAIALDLCEAIDAIWKWDIVHRDIKPSNILLTKEGQAKLTDFGVAQVGHETRRTQEARAHPGTPAYKSPEQASSTGYLDQRSDLYALGLVLYEMLTGQLYLRNRVPP